MDIDPMDIADKEVADKENKNPFDPVNPGDVDVGENIPMTSTSTHDPFRRDETSFVYGVDEHTPLIRREERVENAWDKIREKYPNINPAKSSFTATLDEYGNVVVKLKRMGGRARQLFDAAGDLNEKLPASIKKSLGPPAEEVKRLIEEEVAKREEKLRRLETKREEVAENQREAIDTQIEETESEIEQLERENEVIEEGMSLKDRVKAIFKKYGFTTVAMLTAVGVVIGVIVSNLKAGLTSVAKGVGSGLKAIGKKLGEILPGMVGAIASFIFKTAGEVVGFLAKNAWLLIVGVVLYFVDQFKRRRGS